MVPGPVIRSDRERLSQLRRFSPVANIEAPVSGAVECFQESSSLGRREHGQRLRHLAQGRE